LLVLIPTAVGSCSVKQTPVEVKETTPLQQAAEQALIIAMPALLQQKSMDAGTVWLLQRYLRLRPDEKLDAFVDDAVIKLAGSDYERLVNPEAERVQLPEDPGEGAIRLANYHKAAVGKPDERAIEWLGEFLEQPGFGYVLTHQFLVIQWAESSGLSLPGSLREQESMLLERIVAEQAEATVYSDMYAERTALILLYGSPAEVEAARWIETIIGEQLENGLWDSRPASAGGRGNRHPTALSMLALAVYLESY
jgi:hypothetical protein